MPGRLAPSPHCTLVESQRPAGGTRSSLYHSCSTLLGHPTARRTTQMWGRKFNRGRIKDKSGAEDRGGVAQAVASYSQFRHCRCTMSTKLRWRRL